MSQSIDSGMNREEGLLTSGSNLSPWIDTVEPLIFTPVTEPLQTDTLIIGGGIAGVTVAYTLAKKGIHVVLIDDGYLGSGETGRTTAHIVNALDDRYFEIEKEHGEDVAKLAAQSHTAAIDRIEQIIADEKIDCEFARVPGYLFLHPSDERKSLEAELHATHRAGIETQLLDEVPGISAKGPALMFPRQGQFHPMKYLKGLAAAIIRNGGQIFTESHARKISENEATANGHTIRFKHCVVATNTPVNDLVTMHTKQHPYRTYVLGALIPKGSVEQALWWDTGNLKSRWVVDPYHYVRIQSYNDASDLLIAGGEDHKTGQADDEKISENERFTKLLAWTREKFPMITEVVYHWSGQVLEPVDSLAFIGRNPGDKNIFIATGDSGNGMTHGTIAGALIPDLIMGIENPWEKIYSPSRITLKATGDFLREVGNMTVQYLDLLSGGDIKSVDELQAGNGAILSLGGKKIAVFRDTGNQLHAFSAICPHLGCVVQWNDAERSFDCPCHGSRFTTEGKVVNGPAIDDLKKVEIRKSEKPEA